MLKKKFLVLSLLLVGLLAISAVGAADNVTDDSVGIDINRVNDNEMAGVDEGTFTALQNKIDNADEGTTITLENDYSYDGAFERDGITVSKSLIIDGKGFVIYAKNNSRIFNVTADDVVIKNLAFANGAADGSGGAVYWSGANGVVSNCSFFKNTAGRYGGAVFLSDGSNNVIFSDCSFENNTAENCGGAIYLQEDSFNCTVSNCSFKDNAARKSIGGAIFWLGDDGVVSDSFFVNNSASSGGAIYWRGSYAAFSGCVFVKNTAYSTNSGGGAIRLDSGTGGQVFNCSFINNSADSYFGGAVCWYGYNGSVSTSSFADNSASFGGAVAWYSGNADFSNCSFADNVAEDYAGAIYWVDDYGVLSDCSFSNNSAGNYAGAIYWRGEYGLVSGSDFTNNTAGDYAGAVYWSNARGRIHDCSFLSNSAGDYGGALHWSASMGNLSACRFENNCAGNYSGAVHWSGYYGNVSDCSFVNNAAGSGGAIGLSGANDTVLDCRFENNSANADGGAVFWSWSTWNKWYTGYEALDYGIISGCSFNNNTANGNGGAIFWDSPKGTVQDSIFVDNTDSNDLNIFTNIAVIVQNNTFAIPQDNSSDSSSKEDPKIIIPSLENLPEGGAVTIAFPDDASGNVTLTVNGKEYVFDVVGGMAQIVIPDLDAGSYDYTIEYSGDSKYSSFASNGKMKVNETGYVGNDTSVNATEENTTVGNIVIEAFDVKVVYLTGSYYTISVYGADGKPAGDVSVDVKVNNQTFRILETDVDGAAGFEITQNPGKYTLTIAALNKTETRTLTVKHIIKLKKVKVKKSAKRIVLTASLKKVNGKYLKKKKVTFKFNGKKYKVRTNKKGVAKLTIKSNVLKRLKVGKKITYLAKYKKDTVKKSARVAK